MDNLQFVRDGVTRLPPGFRFQPTDDELVFQYLKCKVFSSPLPAPIIPHINIYKYDPWDLPGNLEQERYFFSNNEAKYPNGNRINRATASGYWKATGLDKQILSSSRINQMLMGMKKTLVFYRGKAPHESRTDWIMHEYRLVTAATNQASSRNYSKEMENWVICKIFMKKRTRKGDANDGTNGVALPDQPQPRFYDFMMRDRSGSCAATSSCSSTSSYSGIREISSNGSDYDDDGESSSGNNINFLN